MEIVIYAAGLGSRLGKNIPKALVEVGGKMLIEHQLTAIGEVFPGIPVRIMAGYQYQLFKQTIQALAWEKNPVSVHLNPFFECGILGTAWTSLFAVNDPDILRIDGDVYFTKEALIPLKNIRFSTILLTGVSHHKTTMAAFLNSRKSLKEIKIIKDYCGNSEWVCIERYLNGEYQKIVRHGVENLPLNAYYYEAMNMQTSNLTMKTRTVVNIYEIDTLQDLQVCEEYLAGKKANHGK